MAKKKTTKKKKSERTEKVKSLLTSKRKKEVPQYLSSGSSLFNMALTGNPDHGFATGSYTYLVGDSMSGKTWFSLSCMAEASIDSRFDEYRFIYDNVERGARMSMERFFGKRMADRLEPPRWDGGAAVFSQTIEDMYFHLDDALDDGRPFIYVVDSMDSLSAEADDEKFKSRKKKARGNSTEDESGSYGTAKAKANSTMLRTVMGKLEESGSILVVISQTRDNIGFGSQYNPRTRSGGRALRFYADVEVWTSVIRQVKKTYRGKKRPIGTVVKLEVQKNRNNGKMSTVEVPFFYSVGIDEVGSMVDYLVGEGVWEEAKKTKTITATGLGPELHGRRETLIKTLEEQDMVPDLRELCSQVWQEIEEAIAVKRKSRY